MLVLYVIIEIGQIPVEVCQGCFRIVPQEIDQTLYNRKIARAVELVRIP